LNSVSCPICGGNAWLPDSTASKILALDGRHAVVVCASCRQRRLDPQLAPEELSAVYSGAYFQSSAPVERLSGVGAPPADYATEVVESRLDKFVDTLRAIKAINPSAVKLLDVGAATGEFVRMARKVGFDADGIELSEFAIKQADRQNSVRLRRLLLADVPGTELYDVIHLNHVFEHFNDPRAELSHMHRLLRHNGVLYLEVPYQFNLVERFKHATRPQQATLTLHSLHHAYFYRPDSLARLVAANGFKIHSLSVFDPGRYPVLSASDRAKGWVWRALALFGIGNHIELYALRI
jgi:2-polyprenyl-3-methyl-5-hydroxy-6-metoxy-1,4-benzoquinol methylase